jgi:predicted N-acyltransferase
MAKRGYDEVGQRGLPGVTIQAMPTDANSNAATAVIRIVPSIADIPAEAWDACANPEQSTHNPFLSHAFLKALEDAKCVGGRTGWLAQHIVLEGEGGSVSGVAPAYVKGHSQGEYIFDYGWADAYERAGGNYYPKLQLAVPFTPVPGRRLLALPGEGEHEREALLAQGAVALASQHKMSSVHLTFLTEGEWSRLAELGFLQRTGKQYHFANAGYGRYEDFLETLASRKRKGLRKERAEALSAGIDIEWVEGKAITEAHWDAFFVFYMETGSRKWGRPYLNRRFFSLLGAAMADRCLLVMAKRGGRYVAGALNLVGGDCVYGRYWGAIEHHACLHFEVCYHQAIDYAIAHKLARVEAGAQGDHKLARGYMPVATYSSHWIADRGFRRAVERFLDEEREQMARVREALAEAGPFRKSNAAMDSACHPSETDPRMQEQD